MIENHYQQKIKVLRLNNWTELEVERALLFHMRVPKNFWGDSILTACYLIKRMPSRVLKYDIPLKIIERTFPTSKHLFSSLQPRIFGCMSYVHDQS